MSGGGKSPQGYQPTGQAQADTDYQKLYGGATPYALNLPGQVIPGVQNAVSNLVSNPYAPGFQGGANQAGTTYSAFGGNAAQAGSSLFGAGNAALNTAFDPQSALYARQFQQLMDQTGAINAQAGVGTSPYGAGLQGQAAENFNLDWLNQALQRQQTGIATANNAFTGGANLGTQAGNFYNMGGQVPYDAYGTIGQNQINAYNALSGATTGALQPGMTLSGDLAQYLDLGQSATGLAQAAQAQNYAQNQSMLGGLGNIVGTAAMFAG